MSHVLKCCFITYERNSAGAPDSEGYRSVDDPCGLDHLLPTYSGSTQEMYRCDFLAAP